MHHLGYVEEVYLAAKEKKKNKHENIGSLVMDNLYVEKNNINKNKSGCASVDGAEKSVKYSACTPCSLKGSQFKI